MDGCCDMNDNWSTDYDPDPYGATYVDYTTAAPEVGDTGDLGTEWTSVGGGLGTDLTIVPPAPVEPMSGTEWTSVGGYDLSGDTTVVQEPDGSLVYDIAGIEVTDPSVPSVIADMDAEMADAHNFRFDPATEAMFSDAVNGAGITDSTSMSGVGPGLVAASATAMDSISLPEGITAGLNTDGSTLWQNDQGYSSTSFTDTISNQQLYE
jgi:hypothetical protein